ncbi:MAG TPA: glycosyltransferase [Steroidobacteraceae bacterium]|jgi:glycosyltransferase involved in cell wall biosynthesis|nr:glycosyltransferase [Steroidobacteraceae bacterium]
MTSAKPPGVLFLVNSLGTGGAEKQVVTLLNNLDASRFRLHLAYLKRNEQLLPQLERARLAELVCLDVTHRIDLGAVRRLRRLVAERAIEAIVCTNSYSTLYGYLARHRHQGGVPRLATVFHTTFLRTRGEKARMLLYRPLFNRCDRLIYVCESQRRHWRKNGMRAAADEVIHNGIDTAWYSDPRPAAEQLAFRRSLGFGDEDFVIGLCAGFRPEKAHGDLLAAVAKLRALAIPAKALLIGEGPERPAIERHASQLGIREHVVMTGVQQDVRPFVRACDVMTLVSHAETFSLAALESMSLGRPLVMSDLGGAGEQVVHGEHGFLFPPGDIEALSAQLHKLTNRALRARLAEAGALRVRERFTVQAMSERFNDCLEGLTREPGRSARPRPDRHDAASKSAMGRPSR